MLSLCVTKAKCGNGFRFFLEIDDPEFTASI